MGNDGIRDAIVIGSGFGGSVAALRLVQGGLDTLLLERGRRFLPGDFTDPRASTDIREITRMLWDPYGGLWEVSDLERLQTLQAAGYGGGSLIYANVQMRAPAAAFEGWPQSITREALEPYYDLAAYMLEIGPDPQQDNKDRGLEEAARGLGLAARTFKPNLAVMFESDEATQVDFPEPTRDSRPGAAKNRFGAILGTCDRCGGCIVGCNHGAKNTLDKNYLRQAEALGLRVRTSAEVLGLSQTKGVWSVTFLDRLEGLERTERARNVFVCAGAKNSLSLLFGSDVIPAAQRAHLGASFCPNADQISAVLGTKEPTRPQRGPTISRAVVYEDEDAGHWFMVQDCSAPRACVDIMKWLRLGPAEGQVDTGDRTEPSELEQIVDDGLGLLRLLDLAPSEEGHAPGDAVFPELMPRAWRDLVQDVRMLAGEVEGEVTAAIRTRLIDAMSRRLHESWGGRLSGAVIEGLVGELVDLFEAKLGQSGASSELQEAYRFGVDQWWRSILRRLDVETEHPEHRALFLTMGWDAGLGRVHLSSEPLPARVGRGGQRIRMRYEPPAGQRHTYDMQHRFLGRLADQTGGELVRNPMAALLQRPVTVHAQGGCPMGPPEAGVVDERGKVHGVEGLYVLDASIFPRSVGVNPSATILAVAERAMAQTVPELQRELQKGATEAAAQDLAAARAWAGARAGPFEPLDAVGAPPRSPASLLRAPARVSFEERMQGFVAKTPDGPYTEHHAFMLGSEIGRRIGGEARLELDIGRVEVPDLEKFLAGSADPASVHEATIRLGDIVLGGSAVEGTMGLLVDDPEHEDAQHPAPRALLYDFRFCHEDMEVHLYGKKLLIDDRPLAYFDDVTTLFTTLKMGPAVYRGVLRLRWHDFFTRQVPSFEVHGLGQDNLRRSTALARFFGAFGARSAEPYLDATQRGFLNRRRVP